jgi:ABC-2 type transport system ATP-binding protein
VSKRARDAVVVDGVTKCFRLYQERNQSLKATIMRRRRSDHEDFLALDDVSVRVREGSTVGFIGENGSGKSTLLKCIARILQPDKGEITVNGKLSALLELGAGFHPELSGRDNVYLNGTILGLSKRTIDQRFDDIVGFAGLERFIDSPVKNYSSGMYVRLGFSVAINVDPDILAVDEVLAVGDEQFQSRCADKFAELRADGRTIVLVSHSLGSVRNMCDDVVWLANGKVRKKGKAGDVIDAYMNEMHQGHEQASGGGHRWGSHEAEIEKVELLNAKGKPTKKVKTGDAVSVRLHYRAHEPIPRPNFGVMINTREGLLVSGPNTREAGLVPEKITGPGVIELKIPRLLLLPGTYDLSGSLCDYAVLHVFDFHQNAVRFDVEPGLPYETFGGVTSLDGTFDHTVVDGDG